ncbi:hypothetical protein ME763_13390 [Streptomyces murinus]|uniref:hypothetical protein n=1 Tax=Streptomyces murinus TaxID=33900 RepID=UPI0018D58AF0|nr:hypothetical protein [Streptomyces murinus]WDO06586.1 hypothetical protein ME763_13390 [Streptomyces murinus]
MGERDGDRRSTGRAATPDIESHLGTALRAYTPDPEAEHRALAAFRTAHATGRAPRTRPRDDWRPTVPRRRLRTVLTLALASLHKSGENGASSKRGDRKK